MKISEKEIYNFLKKLGTPMEMKGYTYIKEALLMLVSSEDTSDLLLVTKNLYPELAKRFNTTAIRVERAVRHAIERVFDRIDLDMACEVFGTWDYERDRPTNKQFFASILEYLKQNYSKTKEN